MKKHCIYIITDSNRLYLEVGYCTDISLKLHEIEQADGSLFSTAPKFNRIVYSEEFLSFEAAQKRVDEIKHFTRMQKERLIRKHNPNWLNIIQRSAPHTKKAVVYA
jgi:putative endonuclease